MHTIVKITKYSCKQYHKFQSSLSTELLWLYASCDVTQYDIMCKNEH